MKKVAVLIALAVALAVVPTAGVSNDVVQKAVKDPGGGR